MAVHKTRKTMLFIRRSDDIRTHSGQVGLPGGKIEESEEPFEAALREGNEELGLERAGISLVGKIDRMQTITNFLIHPFVCLWQQDQPLQPDGTEVTEFFEVPIEFLLEPKNCRIEVWKRHERTLPVYFWEHSGQTIWGVTGALLARFFFVCTGEELSARVPPSASRQEDFRRRFRR